MSLRKTVANALSFASLAGLTGARASAAEDDDEKKDKDKDTDAEGEEEEAKAEGDDKPKDDGDGDKDGKDAKAKKAEGDDKDGEEEPADDEKPNAAAARERARCARIVAHGVKTDRIVEACTFAFDTSMSAAAAIQTLDTLAAAAPKQFATATLHERMAGASYAQVRPEAAGSKSTGAASAAAETVKAIQAAAAKARGEA